MDALPDLALLVVMSTTPLAAREPYIEAAAASFKKEIFSISAGLKEFRAAVFGNVSPSTITRGSVPLVDELPLIRKFHDSRPGCAELLVPATPGTCPCNAARGLAIGPRSWKVFAFTVDTAPVNEPFLAVPYPTTTTSPK